MSTYKTKTKAVGAMVLTFLLTFSLYSSGNAQGVLDRLEKKVETKVEKKIERKVDKSIDNGLNKAENKLDGKSSKKNDKKSDKKTADNDKKTDTKAPDAKTTDPASTKTQPAATTQPAANGTAPKTAKVNMFAANNSAAAAGSLEGESVNTEANNLAMMASMANPGNKTTQPAATTSPATNNNSVTGNNSTSGTSNAGTDSQVKTNTTPIATTNNATNTQPVANTNSVPKTNTQPAASNTAPVSSNWTGYDFTPGELVIFADNQAKAKNGEFPNDFKLLKGSAEYNDLGNEKAVSFLGIPTEIAPKMKTDAFLPQVFTVEFDAYFHNIPNESYVLRFKGMRDIEANINSVTMGDFNGYTTDNLSKPAWRHIAVVFNPQGMKMYIDQFRVVNIPKVDVKPSSFTIYANNEGAKTGDRAMIRNFRLFDASVVPEDRLKADGKIVSHGITFAPGSPDLNPEGAGTLNMIAEMMKADPDMKMSIEVHIDKTGAPSGDLQILTDQRALNVKKALIALGVSDSRLTAKGLGDFKPVDSNDTAAGRENNRRVEFVKL